MKRNCISCFYTSRKGFDEPCIRCLNFNRWTDKSHEETIKERVATLEIAVEKMRIGLVKLATNAEDNGNFGYFVNQLAEETLKEAGYPIENTDNMS